MPIKSHIPLGTLEECQSLGLNPAEYATCSKPNGAEGLGCSEYHKCPWKNGPMNLGVRVVKKGTNGATTFRRIYGCTATVKLDETLRDNKKGFVQVMAREGEEFTVTEKVKEPPNPAAPLAVVWKMDEVKKVVPPHATFKSVYKTNIEMVQVQRMLEQGARGRDELQIAGLDPGPLSIMEVKQPRKASDERTEGEPERGPVGGGDGGAAAAAPVSHPHVGRRSG